MIDNPPKRPAWLAQLEEDAARLRAGLPLPLYYGTITELLNSVTSFPSGSAPLSGTEIVYVIQNGVPVQIPVSDIGSGGGGGVAATYYGRCSD